MVVGTLTVIAVIVAVPSMLTTLWLIYKLGNWWSDPFGRLVFGSLTTLKVWITLFLIWFLVATMIRDVTTVQFRQTVNLCFALLMDVQAIVVGVGLYRYRRGQITIEEEPEATDDGREQESTANP